MKIGARSFTLIIAILAIQPFESEANSFTNQQLLDLCESEDIEQVQCMGYVQGVSELSNILMTAGAMDKIFCLPTRYSIGQLQKIVINHNNNHPEKWQDFASMGVLAALAEAFPCEK